MIREALIYALCGLILILWILVFVHYVPSHGLCGNEVIRQTSSPDGRYVATFFERSCGATTPFSRMISLSAADGKYEIESPVFSLRDQPDVAVRWIDPRRLAVESSQCLGALHQKRWRDVEVDCSSQ